MKVGGLGSVMDSLPRMLREQGHDARIMIPRYATMDTDKFPLKTTVKDLKLASAEVDSYGLCVSNVLEYEENGRVTAYFLENMEYYEKRANVYGYADDPIRWLLLCRGVLEFVKKSEWKPDVIVASDWQTGLIPNMLHVDYAHDPALSKIATIFSIHNLSYQGMFDHHFVSEMDYDEGQSAIPAINDERLLKLNFMRRGIRYADIVNTVSPTYAQEITTPEYGELLDDLLRERRSSLFGILNGIDCDSYNPEVDGIIEFKYGVKTLYERAKNKTVLRKKFNLPDKGGSPILSIVSRLTDQKGFGLFIDAGEHLLNNYDFQFVVLGTGDAGLMSFFRSLGERYPDKVSVHLSFDEKLPHYIFAGSDAILIPSKYEPSGLTQMEAMKYGAIPIVRKTGGLADSVTDYDPKTQTGNGFVFEKFDNYALYGAIVRMLETYRYPNFWTALQKRAMNVDFSWGKSAAEYVGLFKKAIVFHKEANDKESSLRQNL